MSKLYIEPFSGLSGDMFLSALCGLTDGYSDIKELPEKLNLPDGQVEIRQVNKNGIVCRHVRIIDLNGNPHQHGHHHHDHEHQHDHHHDHEHQHDHHHQEDDYEGNQQRSPDRHRHLKDIIALIDAADITEGARVIAKKIFMIIGKSEARIHDMPLDSIHFHEVSAVDSILDIVGCAVLLDRLQIEKTYCDPVCTGTGMVKTQHGMLPVPAPATADIMTGLPTYRGSEKGEKLTPTGAAILRYLQPDFDLPMLIGKRTAYGPGQKDFFHPNVVRISLVEEWERPVKEPQNEVIMIEANLDDTSAEYLGIDFQDSLLRQGAIDFYYTPVQMKKGRPGLKLTVLTAIPHLDRVAAYLLEHTTTIGLRYHLVKRKTLARKRFQIDTPFGAVWVKEVTTPSGRRRRKIEYESLVTLSRQHDISIRELHLKLNHMIEN